MYNSFEQCYWIPIMNTSISNKTFGLENWSNYTEQLTSIEIRNEQAIKSNENVILEHWCFHDKNFTHI